MKDEREFSITKRETTRGRRLVRNEIKELEGTQVVDLRFKEIQKGNIRSVGNGSMCPQVIQ